MLAIFLVPMSLNSLRRVQIHDDKFPWGPLQCCWPILHRIHQSGMESRQQCEALIYFCNIYFHCLLTHLSTWLYALLSLCLFWIFLQLGYEYCDAVTFLCMHAFFMNLIFFQNFLLRTASHAVLSKDKIFHGFLKQVSAPHNTWQGLDKKYCPFKEQNLLLYFMTQFKVFTIAYNWVLLYEGQL